MPRVNSCPNPSCAIDVTGWRGSSPARITGLSGTPRTTGASASVGTGSFSGSLGSATAPAATGQVWTAVGWIRSSVARTVRASLVTWQGTTFVAGGGTGAVDTALSANVWTQVRVTGTLGSATFNGVNFHLDVPTTGTAGTLSLSSVRIEQVTDATMTYADGDTSGWVWDGTAGSSTSQESAAPTGGPTLIATYPVLGGAVGTSGTTQTLTTPSFTPAAGEVIVVKSSAAHSDITINAPSGGGLTYTGLGSVALASYCPNRLSTAVVGSSPSAMTVSVGFVCNTTANRYPLLVVERWTGSLDGTPATNTPTSGTTTDPNSANVTTSGSAASAITWLDADWTPVTTGTVAYRSSATQNYELRNSAANYWSATQVVSGAGTQVIGTTSPTGQKWTMLGVEIKGAATGSVTKTGSDSGTGSETGTVSTTATGNDSGSGSETGYISVPRSGSDSGTGSETGRVDISHTGSDTGSGDAGTGQVSATTTGSDAALGSDSGTIAADTAGSDSGTGADTGHIALPGSDSGTGTDGLVSLGANVANTDTGAGAEGGYVEARFGDLVISLYGVDPADGRLVPLPDFTRLSMSPQRNAAGSITLDYPASGLNFGWLYDHTVGADTDLEIEIWNYGNITGALRGYLEEGAGDDVTEPESWKFAGRFLELRMEDARVEPQPMVGEQTLGPNVAVKRSTVTTAQWDRLLGLGYQASNDADPTINAPQKVVDAVKANAVSIPVLADPKRELKFNAATPGDIVHTLLTQARARGTLSDITTDATSAADSDGNLWPQLITTKYSPHTGYDAILNKLTTDGRIEWAVVWTGTKRVLKLWVAGKRGVDRTVGLRPVVLRAGRNLVESPRKWSVKESVTDMFAAGGEGWYASASDVNARTRRHRQIEGATSSNGMVGTDAVTAHAQWQLSVSVNGTLEVDHSLGFLPGEPRPLIAFDISDWVYSQTGTEMDRYRVVQWSLTVDADRNQTGVVVLNDAHTDTVVRQRQQLAALSTGDTVVGTSQRPPDTGVPLAPEGLVVGSGAFHDGQDVYALVTAGWAAVTTNTDGTSATDIDGYRVEWARNSDPTKWMSAGTAPSPATQLSFTTATNLPILVRVLCYDRSGNASGWTTLAAPHTTDDDVTPPGVPSTPTGANYLGTVAWTWDGKTTSGADMYAAHADFARCELHMSTTSNFTPDRTGTTTRLDTIFGAGTYSYTKLPGGGALAYGTTYYAKLVAVDIRDNASAASGQASATPGKLVNLDLGPDAVERTNIKAAAIGNAQIDTLAVNDGQIMSLGVGKLVAGTLTASMIVGTGKIATGTTGARVEIDSAGLRLFGPADVVNVNFKTSDGSALITGEHRTAQSGARIVLNPGGASPAESRWYPSSTNQYARIKPSTSVAIGYEGQGGVNLKAFSARGDQQSGEVNVYPGLASLVWGNEMDNGTITTRIAASDVLAFIGGPRARVSANIGQYYGIQLSLVNPATGNIVGQSSLFTNDQGPNGLVRLLSDSPNGNSGIQFNDAQGGFHGISVINGTGGLVDCYARGFLTSSDRRLKRDIVRDPLDAVTAVRGAGLYRYKYGTSDTLRIGLMADELPEGVRMIDHNGDTTVDVYAVLAITLAAVRNLIPRVEALERKALPT